MQQFFFRGQLALALGRDLANEDVARPDARPHAHHAVFVQVRQSTLGHIGDIPREFFPTQLGLADFHIIFLDVESR